MVTQRLPATSSRSGNDTRQEAEVTRILIAPSAVVEKRFGDYTFTAISIEHAGKKPFDWKLGEELGGPQEAHNRLLMLVDAHKYLWGLFLGPIALTPSPQPAMRCNQAQTGWLA